jgi:hypothetical protein
MRVCEDCYNCKGGGAAACPIGPFIEIPDQVETGDMNQKIDEYQADQGRLNPGQCIGGNTALTPPTGANPKQAYGDAKVPLQLVPPALTIHAAVALGEADWLRSRQDDGTLANSWNDGLLTLAVRHNRPEILALLLDFGLDPDERERSGR